MHLILAAALLFCAGCASMPQMEGDALPLGKTGWRLAGGADFQKQVWFVMFWRPWGKAETDAAAAADKIVLP
jgi:hypothetical protein